MKFALRSVLATPFAVAALMASGAFGGTALAASEPCGTPGLPTTTVYLPNITKTLGGPAGWVTPFYVQNAGAIQTRVETSFFRFSDGALIACRKTVGLAPGTSLVDNPDADGDLPDDTQFSVVAKSFGAPVVAIVNQVQGSGPSQQALSYSGSTQGDTTVYLPNVTRRFFGYDVPFIVQDLGATAATVTARFISFDGSQTYTRVFTVAPARSSVVDPNAEPASTGAAGSGLVDGTQYAVTLTSNQPIAVVANAHNEQGAPVGFSHNGIGRGATTLYAPYAAKATLPGDTFSPIVVQNLGTTTTDAQLVFTPIVGAQQTFTLRAILAGGAQAFDPRFTAGTTTPCAVASATCLGAGEFSLKITAANPIAAVVLPNSATTAAAYLASTQLSPRALVPAAFRRIGGFGGWSTRVFIYTGASAQLTVRAFVIPASDLMATFTVPVGAAGWTSFDLNAANGLANESQYALTIDAGGVPLTAIAHERAATGGDASMIYEAFGTAALSSIPVPASISVSPAIPTIPIGWTRQLTATVRDQFGGAMTSPPIWTVAPASLATVTQTGFFIAGNAPGPAVVSVSAGAVTTQLPLTLAVPPTVTLGGLSFWSFTGNVADVYTETEIGAATSQIAVEQADADAAQIQQDYRRRYARRPVVYALANSTDFFNAVRTIGGSTSQTPTWAGGLCICNEPHPDWVFINWAAARTSAQITTVRHELTHVMEHQLAPFTALTPTWFDEGNARVEEFTVANTLWLAADQRYRAASTAANNTTFSLFDLTSPFTWSARSDVDARYAYALSTQAVLLLRTDIGVSSELLMFDLMRQGRSFDDAYAIVAGRPYVDFQNEFTARVRALATSPGVATAADTQVGPGLTFILYGLPPNTAFTLRITGTATSFPTTPVTDAYGFYYNYLGAGWSPGPYTITGTWNGGTVTANVTKTQ